MLLTIDIGNSNITLGAYEEQRLLFTARMSTKHSSTADEYAIDIKDILKLYELDYHDIEDCIISSVVPTVCDAIRKAISTLCNVISLVVGPGIKTGLNIKVDDPTQLGADIVAGSVAAITEYTLPCAIIDMGTASTIFVLNQKGELIGGSIAAGVRLTLKALCENTSQLPSIHIEAPHSVIGKNTVDCMKSGLVFGTAAMLDGLLDRIEDELSAPLTVVATGGLSREIIKYCRRDIIYNENLLLDGLREIYEKNH